MSKTHKSFLRWFFDVILLQKVPHSRIFHELSSSPLISANPTQNFQSDSKWISPIDCKTAFGFRCAHSPQELSLPLPPSSLDPCLLVFECGGGKSIFFSSHISSEGRVRSFLPSFLLCTPCEAVGNPPSLLLPCNSTFVSWIRQLELGGGKPSQKCTLSPLLL